MSENHKNIERQLQESLKQDYSRFFHGEYPTPRDFRISLVTLLETQDYAIFQSEPHRLDKVTLTRGIITSGTIERVECHESKSKQEIRRVGKRLIRKLLGDKMEEYTDTQGNKQTQQLLTTAKDTTDKEKRECHIPDCLCGQCRDCRLWGFAAAGGEDTGLPSRVDVGTAYSIRAVDEINRERTWNAVDESVRHVQRAVGEKEQVRPEVFMPYVIDGRDLNLDEFLYLLYSILNSGRIGAGRTKYGAIDLHLLAVFFTHEQLFSNKRLTQHAYDYLYSDRKGKMTEQAKRLGWLADLTLEDARSAVLDGVAKELDDAACWFSGSVVTSFPESKEKPERWWVNRVDSESLTNVLTQAKLLFRNPDSMVKIVDNGVRT